MTEQPKPPPTDRELREATLWRVVRAAYLRVAACAIGKDPQQLTEPEQEGLLDQWHVAMELDVERLLECMRAAEAAGASGVRGDLHQSGVERADSHELLDEALEYVRGGPPADEAPLMAIPRHIGPTEGQEGKESDAAGGEQGQD